MAGAESGGNPDAGPGAAGTPPPAEDSGEPKQAKAKVVDAEVVDED